MTVLATVPHQQKVHSASAFRLHQARAMSHTTSCIMLEGSLEDAFGIASNASATSTVYRSLGHAKGSSSDADKLSQPSLSLHQHLVSSDADAAGLTVVHACNAAMHAMLLCMQCCCACNAAIPAMLLCMQRCCACNAAVHAMLLCVQCCRACNAAVHAMLPLLCVLSCILLCS